MFRYSLTFYIPNLNSLEFKGITHKEAEILWNHLKDKPIVVGGQWIADYNNKLMYSFGTVC